MRFQNLGQFSDVIHGPSLASHRGEVKLFKVWTLLEQWNEHVPVEAPSTPFEYQMTKTESRTLGCEQLNLSVASMWVAVTLSPRRTIDIQFL